MAHSGENGEGTNSISQTTSRRNALKRMGLLGSAIVVGTVGSASELATAAPETLYDADQSVWRDSSGEVKGEFHSNIAGYTNVNSDYEVQQAPSLAYTGDNDAGETYVFQNPELTFEISNSPGGGDPYITTAEAHSQEANDEKQPLDFATDALWDASQLPGPNPLSVISDPEPDVDVLNDKEKVNIDYVDSGRVYGGW